MPNQITADGLETKTQQELIDEFTADMQAIYGVDINLDPDSPDGQMMLIFIQAILDNLDLLTQIYTSFDPDQAIGKVQDQRYAINGIQRQAGTFTITPITITLDDNVTLNGIDTNPDDPYTIRDDAGVEWQLQNTFSAGAGAHVHNFQAAEPGETLTTPNTITVPVTIVLGVVSVNNPTTYTTLGIDEETDVEFKVRRGRSVALGSQGYLQGLIAALENVTGVTSVQVYENKTGAVDGDGIPSHSIWVIVSGTADDADIANAIYQKRNAGAGMKGDETYVITQVDGSPFVVRWDEVEAETLYIEMTLESLDGVNAVDYATIRSGLVTSFVPGVFEQVNVNDLACEVQELDDNALMTAAGFSLASGGPFTAQKLTPSSKDKQFVVSEANIILLPILVTPDPGATTSGQDIQFSALGGFGAIAWSVETDNSGGAGITVGGLYTAGAGTGTDTIRATDDNGNFVDVDVVVS